MTDDLNNVLARLIKDRVRLHLGPNALAQANAGDPVSLDGGEADHVAAIALEMLADLDLIAARSPMDDDLRQRIAALFRNAPGEENLGDQTPGEIADAVLAELAADLEAARLSRMQLLASAMLNEAYCAAHPRTAEWRAEYAAITGHDTLPR